MPELPEVHEMVVYLNTNLLRASPRIVGVLPERHNYLSGHEFDLLGQVIQKVTRKAKYMLFYFPDMILVCHNRFTGYWDVKSRPWSFDYLEYARKPTEKDVRLRFQIENLLTDDVLSFHDARCLAVMSLHKTTDPTMIPFLDKMGPDVVTTETTDSSFRTEWDLGWFIKQMKDTKVPIKLALLDQTKQAGIGNIYACEALWWADVNPFRSAQSLTETELTEVYWRVKQVMSVAVTKNVIYNKYIQVFRAEKCTKCTNPIVRGIQAKRGTYYCPVCQI